MPENDLDLRNRVDRLEKEIDDLYNTFKSLEKTIYSLNTTVALLDQTIKGLQSSSAARGDFGNKVTFSIVGVVISAAVAFVLKGGLVQ